MVCSSFTPNSVKAKLFQDKYTFHKLCKWNYYKNRLEFSLVRNKPIYIIEENKGMWEWEKGRGTKGGRETSINLQGDRRMGMRTFCKDTHTQGHGFHLHKGFCWITSFLSSFNISGLHSKDSSF